MPAWTVSEWDSVKTAHIACATPENMYLVLIFYQVGKCFDIQALKMCDLWNYSHLDSEISGKECQQINISLEGYK